MKEISNVKEFLNEKNFKSIKELISGKSLEGKAKVLEYLKSFKHDCVAEMTLVDEITGKDVGLSVYGYEDGVSHS